ncbi:tRNA (N6-threonylcarbamoyladenosine(37)-N6)-methyltransferase TrmO [uncultured Lutibacter sp.]|uniref:tRNA (N6-threonylcarbamoyladenosine(37)-N6)-methyltransferase TrmO n=1 Tax=uncultured Lutibacter sp. TaxID=437739 RepID=UPI0026322E19|nr:tRNA (N6-threonylcarbamoyladenosine(37)-N6)-methyltransferase TrmO [uncultured Lutibacter sp.]
MELKQITINPIGIVHTPFNNVEGMPIQPLAAKGIKGYIALFPEYIEGLKDLDGFSHITLLYYFHKIKGYNLTVKPFMDTLEHGIFATKSPKRPNSIGFSTVKLLGIEKNIIHIEMVDMLNETPLIDIKPFFSRFDNRINTKSGWLDKPENLPIENLRADTRFKN